MSGYAHRKAARTEKCCIEWLLSGEHTLTYNDIRDAIVILTRMTGYDDDDIYEYLENSFESLYWEWGYFAMILADV